MEYRRAGEGGIVLPRVSLGLLQNFGTDRPEEVQRQIILHAGEQGITQIDLANNYEPPYGAAETVFGRVLASNLCPYRDELPITIKAGYDLVRPYGDGDLRKYLTASLDASLRHLGLEYVDVFYSLRRGMRCFAGMSLVRVVVAAAGHDVLLS